LYPENGFPNQGGFSVAMRIHQALTTGMQSAWVYWTFVDGDSEVSDFGLTNQQAQASSPKYNAAKHFFRHIRPGAVRVDAASDAATIWSSAYVHDEDGTLTVVLLNTSATDANVRIQLPTTPTGITRFDTYATSDGSYWQAESADVYEYETTVLIPRYGVVTLVGQGAPSTGLPGTGESDLVPTFEAYPN